MNHPHADPRTLGRSLITDADFNRYLDDCLQLAQTIMQGRKDFPPHLVAFHRAGEGLAMQLIVLNVPFHDAETKYRLMNQTGFKLAEDKVQVVAIYIIHEAWASQHAPGESRPLPADDPNHREVVIVSGLTLDRRPNIAVIETLRNPDNTLRPGEISKYPYDPAKQGSPNKMLLAIINGFAASVLTSHAKRQRSN